MKKSLIALAVLASTGAAMAQSSVTVYGRLDGSVGSIDEGKGSDTKFFSGGDAGLTTPRLGFKGTEDLGGGLKANFQLEQRINIDTGALQSPSFKGASTVGLAGSFGQVRAGRMTTSFDDVRALSNNHNVFDSNGFTATGFVFESFGAKAMKYNSRPNGSIRFDSAKFGGVYGSFTHAFEQTAGKDDTVTAFHLGYKAGGLNVAVGFQDEKNVTENTMLAAAYNFGMLALSGGYQMGKTAGGKKENGYNIGVEVPVGAIKLSAGYSVGDSKSDGFDSSGFGLGAKYSLSKRTSIYGGYSTAKVETAAGATSKEKKLFAFGVRHDF